MKLIRIKILILIVLSFILLVFATGEALAAGLSLSPASGSFGQGQSFSVTVNVNTGGEVVNAVEVSLTFPADKLKANSISHGGSGFDINAESTVGSGVVRIAKGKLPPGVSGVRKVASVNFTALAQGTATIAVAGQVLRESDSANIGGGGGGATITIGPAGPAKTQPKVGTPTTPVVGTPQPKADAPAPVAGAGAPQISDVKVAILTADSVVITWKTDKRADSVVEYGFLANRTAPARYFLTAENSVLVTDHQVKLNPQTLLPGYLYHFRVVSKDEAGEEAISKDATFLIPGSALTVLVVDVNSRPISGALVKLPIIGLAGTTGNGGRVNFDNLPTEELLVLVQKDGAIKSEKAQVTGDGTTLTIVLDQRVSWLPMTVLVVFLVAVVADIGIVGFWLWKRAKNKRLPPNGV